MIRFIAIAAIVALAPLAQAQTPSLLAIKAIQQAQKAPAFSNEIMLDVLRAQMAAGVKLEPAVQFVMAQRAVDRHLSIEADIVLKGLIDAEAAHGPIDPNKDRTQALYATVHPDAEDDRSFRLMANENTAGRQDTGDLYLATGESYLALKDFAKAESLLKQGLTRGRLTPQNEALARLRLGIAQQRGGKPEEARATWATIKSDTGAEQLAQAWTILSQEGR